MGRDKALILVHGIPMIRRVYDVAVQCCPPVYVISPWGDRYRPVLPASCRFIPELAEGLINVSHCYSNDQSLTGVIRQPKGNGPLQQLEVEGVEAERPGPLVGFYQGLQHILAEQTDADSNWVLLLACDLPNLQPDRIKVWQAQLSTLSTDTIAALPTHPTKGWQPLCGFYHRRCLPSLANVLTAGGRSFQRWLRPGINGGINGVEMDKIYPLKCPDPSMLFNCNSPEDLATVTRSPLN